MPGKSRKSADGPTKREQVTAKVREVEKLVEIGVSVKKACAKVKLQKSTFYDRRKNPHLQYLMREQKPLPGIANGSKNDEQQVS